MSTSSNENTIFDFEVREDEIDLAKSVPKLKGASNWRMWETQMFMMLRFNNPVYVQLVRDEIKMPPTPIYADQSHRSVRNLLFREAGGNEEKETRITAEAIKAHSIQIVASNLELRKHHVDGEEKWERANTRAFLQFVSTLEPQISSSLYDITNVREAYLALKDLYWNPSHHATYLRFKKLVNLRYKREDPHTFVARFKNVLGDYTAFVGDMTALQELCHFKRAVVSNPRCHLFILNLTINEEDPDMMNQVYRDFVVAVRLHQMLSKS
ncbi:unnamed protein product [Penicillium nalgiovense]|uniref:Uncharacterized protein n=1 Tax=Penicillium nalgiovense TaxID=60175 RepID=A0A9W4N1V3_PENNA|nr:unnamed protein product [Penicillium nalgiovense]CAG7976384.1 unnamed protein product [Penicillium nalgiovense]CAG7978321.1 unnamed protein product [Penicillium nalgiovense]CAG8049976.1 unnamed protein product [Penicillium nalgiovense]CAG8050359.1 unnamed protein product [Penicillium nalgiovense]